ncbi:lysophospholipid acyltransferase family protein [Candidatus Kapabacteria bacterium]|nr:lysophospholipid acyltransferase family protein [Candidatus Kapabacteria bacterium]
MLKFLEFLFNEEEINKYLKELEHLKGFDFIDGLFHKLNFTYLLSDQHKLRIPSEGAVILTANHPLGALDGLILLKAISEIRKDVKVIASDVVAEISNLSDLIIPVDFDSLDERKKNIANIEKSLKDGELVIFFPSVFVSTYQFGKVQDSPWEQGAINLASKFDLPILPVYIDGKNTRLFYSISSINQEISQFMLFREVLKKRNSSIQLIIGKLIPGSSFSGKSISRGYETKMLKKHVYNIGKNKKDVFKTVNTIIHPIRKELLIEEFKDSILLGKTKDNKTIYLCEYDKSHNIIEEIARLREITFRKVGEGTGNTKDFDEYDTYYKHIIVWDDKKLEIVGSYRLGVCEEIIKEKSINSIYNALQFEFNEDYIDILNSSVELGRSFVQMRYWGSSALDYLWQGIGAFLSKFPKYKYLFGAVSISDSYPSAAKNMLVYYHQKWFNDTRKIAKAKNPYIIEKKDLEQIIPIFDSDEFKDDFIKLKRAIRQFGMSVPTLLRRYVDLTDFGGTKFVDFGVDESFANSIDCFVVVELDKLRADFKERYYTNQKSLKN